MAKIMVKSIDYIDVDLFKSQLEEKNIGLADLADRVGVCRQYFYKAMSGKGSVSGEIWNKVQEILGSAA